MPTLTEEVSWKKHYIRFFQDEHPPIDKRKTEQTGVKHFKDRVLVEVRQAGDKHMISHFLADEQSSWVDEYTGRRLTYKELWPKQYEQFLQSKPQIGDGTAIEVLPDIMPGTLGMLKSMAIHTIEALAALDGTNLKSLGMHGRELKNKAEKFLERTKEIGSSIEADKKLAEAEARIAKLEAMLEKDMDTKERSAQRAQDGKKLTTGNIEVSSFEGWADEDVLAWLKDNGEANVKLTGTKLREFADKLLASKSESEAA